MRAKEVSFLIMPLGPAYKAGLVGDLPVYMSLAKEKASGPVSALIKGESLDQPIEWINIRTAQSRIFKRMVMEEKMVIAHWT